MEKAKKLLLPALACFTSLSLLLNGEPWGKDADLAMKGRSCIKKPTKCETPIFGCLGEALIRFHQEVISPCDGPRSHFLPSSSQYTLDAMRKYGFFQGVMMGCDRLMRENSDDWVYLKVKHADGKAIKLDPVP